MAGTNLTASPRHGNDGFNTACKYYCVTVRRQVFNALEPEKHQLRSSRMRCRVKVAQQPTIFGQIGWNTDQWHVVCDAGASPNQCSQNWANAANQ
jgi:hypothetical protein